MAGSASAVFTNTENQKQCPQKVNVTALHRDPCVPAPSRSLLGCCVWGGSAVPTVRGSGPGLGSAQLCLPKPRSPSSPCWKAPGVLLPSQPRAAAQGRGLSQCTDGTSPLLPRSPEQSKAAAGGPDSCIEPVSPPDGVGEAEHAKSAPYPVLFREGEPMDQRYGPGAGAGDSWGWGCPIQAWPGLLSLLPKAVSHPRVLCLKQFFSTMGYIYHWDRETGWRC